MTPTPQQATGPRVYNAGMVERVSLRLPRLPEAFSGLTVAVVSDLHAGFLWRRAPAVRRVVDRVNALGADLICLLGDLVHRRRHTSTYLPLLGELSAPLGVYACLGNHERGRMWYSRHRLPVRSPSTQDWRRWYGAHDLRLLVNEALPLERDGDRLWLVGVDDPYSRHHDLAAALREVPAGDCALGLAHSPDLLDDPAVGELDLLLAGHTHGGQVHLPGVGPVFASCRHPRRRAAGLVRENGTLLYVTRGVGEGLPFRLGCPRELTLLTLNR